jgi:aspartate racemase
MKTLGIIGGIGPESTIDYYRTLVATYRDRTRDGSYPPVVINSVDLNRLVEWFGAGDFAAVADYLAGELGTLARAGANFGLLAANTPHVVFGELERRSPIPLLSIVEATRDAAKALGIARAGLFGTRFTMRGRFYPDAFAQQGIAIVTPGPEDQDFLHEAYMNELVPGIFRDETRERLLAIVDRLLEQEGIQALILGGTELPLILREGSHRGIPFLDTTRIHVERAVERMLE